MKLRGLVVVVAAGALIAGCSGAGTTAGGGSESASAIATDGAAPETTGSAAPEGATEPLPAEAAPSPTTTSFRDVVIDGKISSAEVCKTLEAPLIEFQKEAARRIGTAQGKAKDSYAAASFRKNYPWVKDPLGTKFEAAMDAAATEALNSLSDGQAGLVDDFDDYLPAAIGACGLEKKYSATEAEVSESESLAQSITTKANNKPWYPKGYDEYGFDGDLAWKWTEDSCGYSYGYCWTIRVKAKDGCYGGLYAEINIEKNGVVLDYANDTLGSLGAGEIAKLEFVHFDRGAGTLTGSLNEINCY